MRTAVSIPDDVYADAERVARCLKKSRSELYAEAIRAYVKRHKEDEITESYNRLADEVDTSLDPFVAAAARRVLERVEWQE